MVAGGTSPGKVPIGRSRAATPGGLRPAWRDLAWTVLPGAVVGVPTLLLQSPWYDEVYTLSRTRLGGPIAAVTSSLQDHVTPLYPFLSWFASLGGASFAGLRVLSLAAFLVSAWLFFRAFRDVVDERTARWAAAAYSVHPLVLWHGQDARMYALLSCLCAGLLVAVRRALGSDGAPSRGRLVAVAGLAFLGAMTHMYALIFAGAAGVHCLVAGRGRARLATLGALAVGAGAALPVIAWMVMQETRFPGVFRGTGLHELGYAGLTFAAGYAVGLSRAELHAPDAMARTLAFLPLIVPVLLAFWTPVFVGTALMARRARSALVALAPFPLVCVLAPFVAAAVTGKVSFNIRYVLPATPFLLVPAAWLLVHGGPRLRWLALGVALTQGLGLVNAFTDERYANEDYRGLARLVEEELGPMDRLYVPAASMVDHVVEHPAARLDEERLDAALADPARRVFVLHRPWVSDPEGVIRARLDAAPGARHEALRGFDVWVLPAAR